MKKLITLLVVIFVTINLFSRTWTVRTSGGDFTTITSALSNASLSDNDVIDIAAGTWTEAKLLCTKSVTIQGAGMSQTIVQAYATPNNTLANNKSVFELTTGGLTITIQNMTIQNGYNLLSGGGFRIALTSATTYNLINLKIYNNYSLTGGGISVTGPAIMNITGCNITNNYSTYNSTTGSPIGGGGIYFAPGGTTYTLNATIKNCNISNNSATYVSPSTGLSGNGGGICVILPSNASLVHSLSIENTTIYNNSTTYSGKVGGGIYFKAPTAGTPTPTQTLTLNHCTIVGNTTNGGSGGDGVCFETTSTKVTSLVMNNSIIIGNTGSTSNASQVGENAATVTEITNGGIANSIFGIIASGTWANSTTNNIVPTPITTGSLLMSTVLSNLTFAGSLSSDATPVLPIGSGSIAKDFVSNNQLSPALTTDQLGNTRSIGSYPDAGAYEYTPLSSTPTITFSTPTSVTKTFGDASFTNAATSTSGGALTYSSDATGVATVNTNTGAVTIVAAGTAHIMASQSANSVYTSGSQSYTLTVNPKDLTPQTITFGSLTSKVVSDVDYSPGASASSGLTVSYASSNASVATIVSNQIHIIGPGATDITASQGGDSNYSAASNVTQNLIVMSNAGFEDVVSTYTVSETPKNVLRRISGMQSTLTSTTQPTTTAITVTNGMWVCNNPKGSGFLRATVVTTDFHLGASSLNLSVGAGSTATNLDDWSNATAQQKLSLLNTQKYAISFWAKADGTANNQCSSVTVYLTDNTLKTKLSCVVQLTGGTSWTQYSAIFDIPAFKAANATADFSTAYFGVGITSTYDPNTLKTNYSGVLLDDFMLSATTSGSIAISTSATNGSVTGAGAVYDSGASATVLAVPGTGYRFASWTESGSSVSTSASYTFTATTNRTLVANFEAIYNVAATAGTGGTMVSGSGTYLPNGSATVVVTPNTGYRFVSWTLNTSGGAVQSTSASYTFTVSANTTLVANFMQQFSVAASAETGGSITSGSGTYDSGASATVVAAADAGYHFVNWTLNTSAGAVQSTSASYSFTVTAAKTLVANFALTVASDANLSTYSPTSVTDVTVTAGELTVDADATVKSMTVAPGAKLTLTSGKTLTVAGAMTLQSDASATATFVNNGGTVSAASTNVEQYLTTGRNWYISSPVNNATTAVFNPAGGSNQLFWYDESKGSTNPWSYSTRNDSSLQVMRGYVANLASTGVVTFSGALNSASSITLNRTAGQVKEGFNLVGNPYPAHTTITKTITDAANALNTIWYRTATWDAVHSKYVYTFQTCLLNANGSYLGTPDLTTPTIAPMQAFWLRTSTNGSTLDFSTAVQSHQSANPLKAPAQNSLTQQILRLQVSNTDAIADETVLYFNPDASNSFDSYDAQKMFNNSASVAEIYTVAGTEDLAINGLNAIQYDSEMPLGFNTVAAGVFSIKASQIANFTSGTQVILKDYADVNRPVTTNLSDGSAYSFSSAPTSNNTSRFTLIFRAPSIATGINSEASADVWISGRNGQLMINGASGNGAKVEVFNAVGQKIISGNLNGSNHLLNNDLAAGVYMVKLTVAGKTITKKVIID